MDACRRRFAAALIGLACWVAALGTMAVRSGREPPDRPAPPEKVGC